MAHFTWGMHQRYKRWTFYPMFWILISKNTNLWQSITVQLISCLAGLDLTKQVKQLFIQHKQSRWIQPNTGDQPCSDTSSKQGVEFQYHTYSFISILFETFKVNVRLGPYSFLTVSIPLFKKIVILPTWLTPPPHD